MSHMDAWRWPVSHGRLSAGISDGHFLPCSELKGLVVEGELHLVKVRVRVRVRVRDRDGVRVSKQVRVRVRVRASCTLSSESLLVAA